MILLFRGRGPVGWLIRKQTWSDYSHAAWLCRDGSVIESWYQGGVRHSPSPATVHGPKVTFDAYAVRGLGKSDIDRIELLLHERVGRGYDFFGVARFLSRVNRNNENRWFCSELIAECCELAGKPLLRAPAYRIAPGHIAWSTETRLYAKDVGMDWWAKRFAKGGDDD